MPSMQERLGVNLLGWQSEGWQQPIHLLRRVLLVVLNLASHAILLFVSLVVSSVLSFLREEAPQLDFHFSSELSMQYQGG